MCLKMCQMAAYSCVLVRILAARIELRQHDLTATEHPTVSGRMWKGGAHRKELADLTVTVGSSNGQVPVMQSNITWSESGNTQLMGNLHACSIVQILDCTLGHKELSIP